ncbi:hypothetical protein DFP72DRAFT_929702 [Ephemerocybe angulata]|uniref:Uncharacterized protein n=1 Tax=Ephemerocybe angulata TaxID=980116 RepID=A0A8H6HDA7_9AGAR|nr:hypothetical protein DFP72DRAFT_929702 [Tulosesus angulatus]
MFWGWAQTDPAGIHASSAPGHGRPGSCQSGFRTLSGAPCPCAGAGRKLTLRGVTHPQLQYVDAGPSFILTPYSTNFNTSEYQSERFRNTTSMFWGWAQTDPAGIHASSAPVRGPWTSRISPHLNANPNAFRNTTSMFRGWAQTDPAGIHASSAPGHGRPRRPNTPRHPGMGSHLPFPWVHWC